MALSAYERQILNAIPKDQQTPTLVKYVMAIAKQLRPSFQNRYKYTEAAAQIIESFRFANQHINPNISVLDGANQHQLTILINLPDQPFIVDTIRMHLRSLGANSIQGFNAIIPIKRNQDGNILQVDDHSDQLESVSRFEVEGNFSISKQELASLLQHKIQIAQLIVQDFSEMLSLLRQAREMFSRNAMSAPENRDLLQENVDFIDWLMQDNFIFMGIQSTKYSYGLLTEGCQIWDASDLREWKPHNAAARLAVRKSNQESPIHRFGLLDEIYIEVPNDRGHFEYTVRIQGLFTYRAVTQSSRRVPILRRTLANIIRADKCVRGSYRYKGICNVFDSLPTEFLFTSIDNERLVDLIDQVLEAEQLEDFRMDISTQERSDTTFVLMALPRSQWSDDKLPHVIHLLKKHTKATYVDQGAFVGRYNTILIHFFLTGTKQISEANKKQLLSDVSVFVKPWKNILAEHLLKTFGPEKSDALLGKYATAFSNTYKRLRPISEVITDIENLEQIADGNEALVHIFAVEERERAYLRVYQPQNMLLSEMLPIIDNFGLKVLDQFADPVRLPSGQNYTIDTFRLESSTTTPIQKVIERAERLSSGIEAVFSHKMTTDSLNHLVLHTGLPWEAVDLMRALHGYARQLGFPYTIDRLQGLFLSSVETLQSLWALFQCKFDPNLKGDRRAKIEQAQENTTRLIRSINNQDQDLAFRTFFNLIDSILRTNFYRTDRKFHYISFKIDCAKVQNMPLPRMMVEVYVHHREMEGIHLRGGKIARGGIRWSDRTDFRREVLDLVATQMVKNVLIIPEGAKGGFRMKEQILDWSERRRKADELYQVLIRGLLDITDNRKDGVLVPPPDVVQHDASDPYLVVAADKGTAHLSDTANRLSREYDFWLDDAFASGGSNGYDHKEVGITARGAWVTTLRNFQEMGVNPRTDTFTAIGIGDPAGDVFGNGVVYLSQKEHPNNNMKLLGAFNHMHIFLDPDPDPTDSYNERVRLFNAVKGWGEYNTELLSTGGGIFSRSAKSIPLSPEVQQMLGVLKDELAPEVVIRLLLRLNVDLVWNGGIGTYVKSSSESHLDAGDPNNDSLRINGEELRAKVIGEGGNLGFTQNGRIEYALAGGRINTDAIDNSGGVDMSDHEVNIKILLNPLVQQGSLSYDARNSILKEMTEEVAQAVLANNNIHALQLSLDKARSELDPLSFSSAIQWVCSQSKVSRTFLRLPSDDELLRRKQVGQGLTRPELAVLAAHVKMHVFKELLASDTALFDDFNDRVLDYFPKQLKEQYSKEISNHMLYPSIGMTMLLNEAVGYGGALLFPTLKDITGASSAQIIRAWLCALQTIEADKLLKEISKLSSPTARYHAWIHVTKPIFSLLNVWLFSGDLPTEKKQKTIRKILAKLPKMAGTTQQDRLNKSIDSLRTRDVPEKLATQIAVLENILFAHEISKSLTDERSVNKAIVSYFSIGEASCFLPTIRLLESRRSSGGWDPAANAILRGRFLYLQTKLTQSIDLGPEAKLGIDRVTLRLNRYNLSKLHVEMQKILEDSSDLSALIVANARAQAFIQSSFSTENPITGTGSIS